MQGVRYDDPVQPSNIPHLVRQLRSVDAHERRAAALALGRLYATSSVTDPPLTEIANLIGEVNDRTADVVATFIRQFFSPHDQAWERQTGAPLSEYLCDMLCRQPDVKVEFAACGLADTARLNLKGSPSVVRKILASGKVWRAYIVASGAIDVASRAASRLATTYQVIHPRAEREGWVVMQSVSSFRLFWCRLPPEPIPHRVFGWHSDSRGFAPSETESTIEWIIHPAELGELKQVNLGRFFTYDALIVGFHSPNAVPPLRPTVDGPIVRYEQFFLRPRKRKPWVSLPAVKSVAARMSAAHDGNFG
jgi:hypothetical protein